MRNDIDIKSQQKKKIGAKKNRIANVAWVRGNANKVIFA